MAHEVSKGSNKEGCVAAVLIKFAADEVAS